MVTSRELNELVSDYDSSLRFLEQNIENIRNRMICFGRGLVGDRSQSSYSVVFEVFVLGFHLARVCASLKDVKEV